MNDDMATWQDSALVMWAVDDQIKDAVRDNAVEVLIARHGHRAAMRMCYVMGQETMRAAMGG